jgi:hypothetical protein
MGVIDFRDPAAIRRWIAVWPERHTAQLRALWRLWPDCRAAMEEAMKGQSK